MHDTARELGKLFLNLYHAPSFTTILDFGAMNINGTLRDYCPPGVTYLGVDLSPGPDVDLTLDTFNSLRHPSTRYDLILATSVFEHDALFWNTFTDLCSLLSPQGILYLNVPSDGKVHRHPLDCWRFYPDAGLALQRWSALAGCPVKLIESFVANQGSDGWSDFVAVFSLSAQTPRLANAYGMRNLTHYQTGQ